MLANCPWFKFVCVNISKKIHVSDVKVLYELLQEN
jgi:hypothetical protein